MIETYCDFCGKIFKKDNNKSKHNFCSRKCKDTWQKEGMKGRKNPFYNKHHNLLTKKILRNLKIGTKHSEEWKQKQSEWMKGNQFRKGIPNSEETKAKMRLSAHRGKDNIHYGKPPIHGYRIYPHKTPIQGIIKMWRWDRRVAQYYDYINESYLYESEIFTLTIDGKYYTYRPDFFLPKLEKFVEIKGYWRGLSKQKFEAFKQQYPNIKIELLMKEDLKNLGLDLEFTEEEKKMFEKFKNRKKNNVFGGI